MLWCCGARHASRRSGGGWRVLESEADIQCWKSAARAQMDTAPRGSVIELASVASALQV